MKMFIVAVRDSALNAFSTPEFTPNVNVALRGFSDAANSKETNVSKHPDDFELYELGTFENETAQMSLLDKPRLVARAKDLVRG